jgi:hypothetical protein
VDAAAIRGAARSIRTMLRVDRVLALELLIACDRTSVRERAHAQMRAQDWALLSYDDLTLWLTDTEVPRAFRERAFALLHVAQRSVHAAA